MSVFCPVVGDLLETNAQKSPNKTAIIELESGASWSYSDLQTHVVHVANSLIENGLQPGDRVATFLKDCVEISISFFATARTGGIFVPINYRLSPEELRYILDDCAVKVLVFDEDGLEIVDSIRKKIGSVKMYTCTAKKSPKFAKPFREFIVDRKGKDIKSSILENDIAMLIYTSGTTGIPKGTVHSHNGVICATEAWTRPTRLTPFDRSIALGPLYHIGPLLSNFMPTLYMGGSNVIQRHFDPLITLKSIKDHAISVMWATPTHLNWLTSLEGADQFDLSSLRVIQYSGAPLSKGLFSRIRNTFHDIDLVNAYGMTEIDSVSVAYPAEHDKHLGSVGKALPKTYIRVVDQGKGDPYKEVDRGQTGEIVVLSPCTMQGYWGSKNKTNDVIKDGWYFTGDLGRMDEDGYLYYVERQDDMIISGGENIYPLEVENTLSKHMKVQSVAIVGIPDEKWGEVVTAFVVRADETVTEQELDEFCTHSNELASYKRPRRYIFVDELPTTSSGKIDKKLLRVERSSDSKTLKSKEGKDD